MRNILLVGVATGVILIFLSRAMTCPPNKIEYRYMPRTLDHQMKDAAFEGEMFEKMFDGEDVWYRSTVDQKIL